MTFEALDQLGGRSRWTGVGRRAAVGRGRMFGPQPGGGDSGGRQRISGLVAAIKGFTHMDQATVAEPVDLAQSLSNTVAVLKSKARAKSVAVVIDVEPGLPRVRGFAGELNQIWANLIDNALDAVPDRAASKCWREREQQRVVVRIIDNGPGIPAEIRERIFDPFFTTKPMGAGHRPGPRYRAAPGAPQRRRNLGRIASRAGRSFGLSCRCPVTARERSR